MNLYSRFLRPSDEHQLRSTFLAAFADYSLKFDLTEKQFHQKFFGKLGLQLPYSPGVFDGSNLVGFIFSALDTYQGVSTAYNGGTGVLPSHRGQQLVSRLYQTLIPKLKENGVTQCILEVLSNNPKAIKAYTRVGFEQGDLLRCFKLNRLPGKLPPVSPVVQFLTPNKPTWELYASMGAMAPTFQDQWSRLARNPHEAIVEAQVDGTCVGVAVFQPHLGRISAFAVSASYRGQGIGTALIQEMVRKSVQPHLTLVNVRSQQQELIRFLFQLNFSNQIDQYEMALQLS